jgi:hypothetical protein
VKNAARAIALATLNRAGAYSFRARVGSEGLVKGRAYLVRIAATDEAGMRRVLTVRVRA